jgi:manganese-dependent inorganic pyrophosphatase
VLLVTDIINNGSMVISIGENADLVERAFKVKLEDDMAWLESVVSRKKQVVPFLMAASQM